jgi:hypothetical protein
MPYSKSKARKDFDAEINTMISVIKSAFKNKHTSVDTKQYVLNCSIFLTSAKMEVYFADFIDSWIAKIESVNNFV